MPLSIKGLCSIDFIAWRLYLFLPDFEYLLYCFENLGKIGTFWIDFLLELFCCIIHEILLPSNCISFIESTACTASSSESKETKIEPLLEISNSALNTPGQQTGMPTLAVPTKTMFWKISLRQSAFVRIYESWTLTICPWLTGSYTVSRAMIFHWLAKAKDLREITAVCIPTESSTSTEPTPNFSLQRMSQD